MAQAKRRRATLAAGLAAALLVAAPLAAAPASGLVLERWPGTGQVKSQVRYRAGKRHGPARYLRADGTLQAEGSWADDRKQGRWTRYDARGRKIAQQTWAGGALHGPCLRTDAAGKVLQRGAYREGLKDGMWQVFLGDGRLHRSSTYLLGKRHGLHQRFGDGCGGDRGARPWVVRTEYFLGLKHGPHEERRCSATAGPGRMVVTVQGSYTCGQRSGRWLTFNADGASAPSRVETYALDPGEHCPASGPHALPAAARMVLQHLRACAGGLTPQQARVSDYQRTCREQAERIRDQILDKGVKSTYATYGLTGGGVAIALYQERLRAKAPVATGALLDEMGAALCAELRRLDRAPGGRKKLMHVCAGACDKKAADAFDVAPSSVPPERRAPFVGCVISLVRAGLISRAILPGAYRPRLGPGLAGKVLSRASERAFHLEVPRR